MARIQNENEGRGGGRRRKRRVNRVTSCSTLSMLLLLLRKELPLSPNLSFSLSKTFFFKTDFDALRIHIGLLVGEVETVC